MKKLLLSSMLFSALAALAQIPQNGLIAHYPFDGNLNDLSGNGYHLTVSGTASYTTDNLLNANAAVAIPNGSYLVNPNTGIMPTGSYTIAYWVKVPTLVNTYQTVLEFNEGLYCRYFKSGTNATAQLGEYISSTSNFEHTISMTNTYAVWQHFAISFDATTGYSYSFLNGQQQTIRSGINFNPSAVRSTGLIIGGGTNSGAINSAKSLAGHVDDIVIYNRVLSPIEINTIKNSTQIPPTSLVACYDFDGVNPETENVGGLNASVFSTSQVADRKAVASNAISFSGTGTSRALFPNNTTLKRQRLSISMWVKPAASTGSFILFAKNAASGNFEGVAITTNSNNTFSLIKNTSTASAANISGGTYTPNAWTHLTATIANDSMKLYVNGVLANKGAANFATEYDANTSFVLGSSNQANFYYPYSGAVDELKFYSGVLTASEVNDLYTSGAPCSSTTGIDQSLIDSHELAYPNPVKDILNVHGNAEIFTLTGLKVAEGNTQIEVSHLPNGIYMLKLEGAVTKIVKD